MEFVKALLELLFSILAIGVSVTLFLLSIENIIEDNDKEAVKYTAINLVLVAVWYYLLIKG
jgi:hypothetical protein